MSIAPIRCFISRAATSGSRGSRQTKTILDNLLEVKVSKNKWLHKILEVHEYWANLPIITVDGKKYALQVLEMLSFDGGHLVDMKQLHVAGKIQYDGTIQYTVISQRRVIFTYQC